MASYLGKGSYLGVGHHDTYGTVAAAFKFFALRSDSDGLQVERERIEIEDLSSFETQVGNELVGGSRVSGSVGLDCRTSGMGQIWRHAFNDIGTSTGSGPYVHAYATNVYSSVPTDGGLTLQMGRGDTTTSKEAVNHLGIKINSTTWTVSPKAPVQVSLDVRGNAVAQVAKPTVVYETGHVLAAGGTNDVGLSIWGTSVVCSSATMTLTNNWI